MFKQILLRTLVEVTLMQQVTVPRDHDILWRWWIIAVDRRQKNRPYGRLRNRRMADKTAE